MNSNLEEILRKRIEEQKRALESQGIQIHSLINVEGLGPNYMMIPHITTLTYRVKTVTQEYVDRLEREGYIIEFDDFDLMDVLPEGGILSRRCLFKDGDDA